MKKIALVMTGLASALLAVAQTGTKPATKPVAKTPPKVIPPKTTGTSMKNLKDSANYAMGFAFANYWKEQNKGKLNTAAVLRAIDDVYGPNKDDSASYALAFSFAKFYKEQGEITHINKDIFAKAINDVVVTNKPQFTDATANACMNNYMMKIQEEKSQVTIDEGNAFLAKNKLREGVKTTPTGLQYEILTETTGPKPTPADSVTCHYRGTLLNGTPFDDSYSRGQPITFSLGGVIAGWTEGLQLMSVGSKYKFYIPYTLGYGPFRHGPIPGGSALIFEVELLDIRKK